ncbi:DNA repair protein RecN [Ignavibacteria bacterium]|nr:DNA repair protein RecN [Bacteroidota bacterium]MCZ2132935.1 DNA repair protein RecN [Bacteroidota bacterium]
MLISLSVRNFALVENITLQFERGLNIITGETGAGKSIIVDALMAAIGERISSDMIRTGADKAVIEAVFEAQKNSKAGKILAEHEYEADNEELILRRELNAKGGSRCFVNDSPAQTAFVRELGNALVDFHGQHSHQSLLRVERHIALLDESGVPSCARDEYAAAYHGLQKRCRALAELRGRARTLRQERDFKEFQRAELELLAPIEGERERLEAELSVIENSEKIHDITNEIHRILYGDDASARDRLTKVMHLLEQLSDYAADSSEYIAECKQAIITVEEIARFAKNFQSQLDFRPGRMEFLRERLQQYAKMQKKYGENLTEKLNTLCVELDLTENFETEIERLRNEIIEGRKLLGTAGKRLSAERARMAELLERGIEGILSNLGMPNAKFCVRCEQSAVEEIGETSIAAEINGSFSAADADGLDRIEFYASMNKGEEPKPLVRVASGGEISRVMLAMKGILAKNDRLPMLVFDEIDVGVSGRIARKVGFAMRELAAFHQLIAITHLPQIAALADAHIAVEKFERDGRVVVSAKSLSLGDRVGEVAKLIGGEAVTNFALDAARELIEANDLQEH